MSRSSSTGSMLLLVGFVRCVFVVCELLLFCYKTSKQQQQVGNIASCALRASIELSVYFSSDSSDSRLLYLNLWSCSRVVAVKGIDNNNNNNRRLRARLKSSEMDQQGWGSRFSNYTFWLQSKDDWIARREERESC